MTTKLIIGMVCSFISDTCWCGVVALAHAQRLSKSSSTTLTLKLFFTRSTTKVPEIGQMQRVMFSIKFSVMHKSVRQLESKVAFESNL